MRPITHYICECRRVMGWTQQELATAMGGSLRTTARWESGQSHFDANDVLKLARLVHPVNRQAAANLAAAGGTTLVDLGIEPPPAPPPALSERVAVRPPETAAEVQALPTPAALRILIDAIVCSLADEENVAPKVMRPRVLLTLQRALEVGLDLRAALAAGLLGPPEHLPARSTEDADHGRR